MQAVDYAIYKTVHDHGGAERLSRYLACRPGTLNNKADPACDAHQLNVREAIALQLATNTRRIIQAEAAELGGTYVQGADWSRVSDVALLDAWATHQATIGRTAEAIRQALADGLMTRAELREIRREMFDDFRTGMELYARLEGLCGEPEEGVMAERIRIEKLPSCTYKIRGEKHDFGWADITIRQWDKGGSISVQSDFGSFNGFWNAIGERDFRAFLALLDYGYFMEKTLPPVSFNIRAGYRFSFEQSKNALREQILLLRRDGDLGRRHARSCWNEVTHF